MSDSDIDLLTLQKRINESKSTFLLQLKHYDEKAILSAEKIINYYLSKFSDSGTDRAKTVHQVANETINEIKSFRLLMADLSFKVFMSQYILNFICNSLTMSAISQGLDKFNELCGELVDHLNGNANRVSDEIDLDDLLREDKLRAEEIGGLVVELNTLAANIIETRTEVLLSIDKGYVTLSLKEAINNFQDHISSLPKTMILEEVWSIASKSIKNIIEYLFEEEMPTSRIKKMLDAIKKTFGKKGVGKGDTDDMMKLIDWLSENNHAVELINKKFDQLENQKNEILRTLKANEF